MGQLGLAAQGLGLELARLHTALHRRLRRLPIS